MKDEKINLALDIVNQQIARLFKENIYNKDISNQIIEKLKLLEKIKKEIYLGNMIWTNKIIEKNEEGII